MIASVVARLYGMALHLYPRGFRQEYGEDMEQLLTDQLRDESTAAVAARATLDLALTLPHQHLEAHMRTPDRLIPTVLLALAVAGLAVAVVGGSEPAALGAGVLIAVVAGAIGIIAWRRSSPVTEPGSAAVWWKFLVAGPCLVVGVIGAAALGVNAWFLGIAVVLTGIGSFAVGIVLGITHLVKAHVHGATA
ncbi:MAG: hypothetical protein MUE36_12290 [Acidimicrobiales bacterium]|jgi:hypothetical protein|nr:hypothetical protein [Acidimicrobiales bacterium]